MDNFTTAIFAVQTLWYLRNSQAAAEIHAYGSIQYVQCAHVNTLQNLDQLLSRFFWETSVLEENCWSEACRTNLVNCKMRVLTVLKKLFVKYSCLNDFLTGTFDNPFFNTSWNESCWCTVLEFQPKISKFWKSNNMIQTKTNTLQKPHWKKITNTTS